LGSTLKYTHYNAEISVFRAFYLLRIIQMDLGEREWGGIDRTDLAEDTGQWRALVNTVMNHRLHKIAGNSLVTSGFSRRAQLHGVII
jgi:hypothetical protein